MSKMPNHILTLSGRVARTTVLNFSNESFFFRYFF